MATFIEVVRTSNSASIMLNLDNVTSIEPDSSNSVAHLQNTPSITTGFILIAESYASLKARIAEKLGV